MSDSQNTLHTVVYTIFWGNRPTHGLIKSGPAEVGVPLGVFHQDFLVRNQLNINVWFKKSYNPRISIYRGSSANPVFWDFGKKACLQKTVI